MNKMNGEHLMELWQTWQVWLSLTASLFTLLVTLPRLKERHMRKEDEFWRNILRVVELLLVGAIICLVWSEINKHLTL